MDRGGPKEAGEHTRAKVQNQEAILIFFTTYPTDNNLTCAGSSGNKL